jgi:4,5-DOPA dioxygenase extradiol
MNAPHPALFIGHGSPMQAIEPTRYTEAWTRIGAALPRPRAILAVSAHWYTRGTAVTAQPRPRTIHDFHGFPAALYAMQYPAPGDPQLAARVAQLLAPTAVALDVGWGLDHGSWSVLHYMYPQHDVPVVQLSIDGTLDARALFELAQRLAPLRDEGVLVLGSGNVVHNLRALQPPELPAPPWARRFNDAARRALLADRPLSLVDYANLDTGAAMSVPTPEHYLPLLYVLALRRANEPLSLPIDGLEMGGLSMLSVVIGAQLPEFAPAN